MIRTYKLINKLHNSRSPSLFLTFNKSDCLSNRSKLDHLNRLNLIRSSSSDNDSYYNYKPAVSSKMNRISGKKQQGKDELENLGLDKYTEIFEANLNAIVSDKDLEEESVKESSYFNKFIEERTFYGKYIHRIVFYLFIVILPIHRFFSPF